MGGPGTSEQGAGWVPIRPRARQIGRTRAVRSQLRGEAGVRAYPVPVPLRLLAALLPLLAAVGCTDDPDDPADDRTSSAVESADPAAVSVEIAFHDASVEPQYHRSWTITADQARMRVVADSYGDVLDESTLDTPPDAWSDFVAALPAALDELDGAGADENCAGGTGLTLEVDGLEGGPRTADSGSCGGHDREVIEDLVAPLVDAAGEAL